ncbi:Rod binding protein [Posidoniimonas polymericola]|uniref:Rod binding protein n=1 Tax=Posidoniimonas polymericola TaxID=2528002 RepID=A0A5C5YER4_9BACT|nr:rod-binding protein [Posidoniimonas polymericola]TWT73534.1 Rod binding protein [Posidoniimonas polymericola]
MNIPSAQIPIAATQGRAPLPASGLASGSPDQLEAAKETKQAFTDFVGKTFYAQMLKSMRQTVGKPAYFDGGRAEEVFRGQLDQTIADKMCESNGHSLADGMFERQFPEHAEILRQHEQSLSSRSTSNQQTGVLPNGGQATSGRPASGLDQLAALRRI